MRLLLIDGNSVLFRAYYATSYGNILKTSKGEYTNAVYAFANMFNKALNLVKPDYCVVAFDKGKHTFRHDLDPDYKGGRKPAPEELVPQFALVRKMLKSYNVPFLEYDGIEADDIIGSLAKKYPFDTCIFTSDHDMLQLIDETTNVYMMKKGVSDIKKMDTDALFEEYSLKPYQIIEYKALAGDSSDNIKGVEGVGDKTAVKLLNEYDTCDGIYEHIDEIKGKLKEKLIKDKESCYLSRTLATIKTDFDISEELASFKLNIDEEGKNQFFEEYEMFSLIKNNKIKKEVNIIKTKVSAISEMMFDDPLIYFVSDEFSYYNRKIYGVCFANELRIEYITFSDLLKDKKTIAFLNSDKHKTVFDFKVLLHCLANYGIRLGKNTDDLYLMAFLVNNYNSDLINIIFNYEKVQIKELKEIFGTVKKPLVFDEKEGLDYAYEVSYYLTKINKNIKKELEDKKMLDLYQKLELPLVEVLYEMEKEGVHCDKKELDEIADSCLLKIHKLENEIYKYSNKKFNISSTKQLAEVLYDELALPNLKKNSTDAEVLHKLVNYHPIISLLLEYRKYTKLYSTYAEGLKKYIRTDNKMHTIFSQTLTQTGRLSSSEPNLQNISIRDDESREIRKAFKAQDDHYFMSCDYSQVELRVLASLADEEKMITAFNSGLDIHTKTAMDVFNLEEKEVTDLSRRHAKAVNFGVVYGISDFGLANQTNLSISDAKTFIENYFVTYPNIKKYLDEQVAFCKENGYVQTMMNRRRYIKEINEKNYMIKEFGKRAAMNATIQGSAADLIKLAMVNVYNFLKDNHLKSKLILQVHDELILDVTSDELDLLKKEIPLIMANSYQMKTKLASSLAFGKSWYEAK